VQAALMGVAGAGLAVWLVREGRRVNWTFEAARQWTLAQRRTEANAEERSAIFGGGEHDLLGAGAHEHAVDEDEDDSPTRGGRSPGKKSSKQRGARGRKPLAADEQQRLSERTVGADDAERLLPTRACDGGAQQLPNDGRRAAADDETAACATSAARAAPQRVALLESVMD
jgi:hypothetical protein